jgi:hypothetical protein
MAKVHLSNVVVLDNPSAFLNPFKFEVTFECIEELKEGIIKSHFILALAVLNLRCHNNSLYYS